MSKTTILLSLLLVGCGPSCEEQGGTVVQSGLTILDITVEGAHIDTTFATKYTYRQSHDSIVKLYSFGGSYMEFELPILLKYSFSPKLAVYGGINIIYSSSMSITEKTYTQTLYRSVDSTVVTHGSASPFAVSDVISYTGTPYSNYTGPVYTMKNENNLRAGYMLGFSYEYSSRWLFDALMQQTPVKPQAVGGYNTNYALGAPYFRLSVGYKFTK